MNARSIRRTITTFLAIVLTAIAVVPSASALAGATITLEPTALAFAPGADASVRIRVEADDPESVSIDIVVEGGTLSGVVAPNLVAPGVADGMAFVRRGTPGTAIVSARLGGAVVASTLVTFAANEVGGSPDFDVTPRVGSQNPQPKPAQTPVTPGARGPQPIAIAAGPVAVAVSLDAPSGAAARTWTFEVVDPRGAVVAAFTLPLSGGALRASATTGELPAGRYTVRPKQSRDLGQSCAEATLFEVSANVELRVPTADSATFTIRPCSAAMTPMTPMTPMTTSPAASAPDDSRTPVIDRVAGDREAGTPLPPNTGTGLISGRSETPGYLEVAVVLMFFTITATAGSLCLVAIRSQR